MLCWSYMQMGHHVHAVDFSKEGLNKTRKLTEEMGVNPTAITFHLTDVATFQPPEGPGTMDAVISSFCHMPQALKQQHFSNIKAMLAAGMCFLSSITQTFICTGSSVHRGHMFRLQSRYNQMRDSATHRAHSSTGVSGETSGRPSSAAVLSVSPTYQ
jgi:cyclopropane fatty-acyl-phospholipid synthase-like methyltransferase